MFKEKTKKENFQLIVAGGVAANKTIRENLTQLSNEMNFEIIYPDLKFCGDNASMIAYAAHERLSIGCESNLDFMPKSRWALDEIKY